MTAAGLTKAALQRCMSMVRRSARDVRRTTPAVFSGDETADVGKDDATQVVAAFENIRDSHFTGSVKSVTVDAMP